MPGTGVGLILIDFVARPFAKILEKMPILMIVFLMILYGAIAFMVLRSAYRVDEHS
jgi:F0F1-type ATP synthase assembly protein I